MLPLVSALFLAAIAPFALHARQLDTPSPVGADDAETLISALTIPPFLYQSPREIRLHVKLLF